MWSKVKVSYSLSKEAFSQLGTPPSSYFYLKNPNCSKFNEEIVIHNFIVIVYMVVDVIMKSTPTKCRSKY